MLPFFMIGPIKLTVALSSASMASAVEVLLISVPESKMSLDMDGTLDFDYHSLRRSQKLDIFERINNQLFKILKDHGP